MTLEQQPETNKPQVTQRHSRWWKVVLALSLAANLLVAGIAIGHRVRGGDMGRMGGNGYVQLVPRKFFAELPRERRRELMGVFRQDMDGLRGLREQADAASLRIADALEKQPFDAALVRQTVSDFATGGQSLAAKGSVIVSNLIEKLTPEERAQLAAAIRDRDKQHRKRN
jgi:hypothetical protein